jgi:hypothetical protein
VQQLAAKEVARYMYLRMDALPDKIAQEGVVVITTKDAAIVTHGSVRAAAKDLKPQEYLIKTTAAGHDPEDMQPVVRSAHHRLRDGSDATDMAVWGGVEGRVEREDAGPDTGVK